MKLVITQNITLDGVVEQRRELAAGYAKAIAEISGLRLVSDPAWGTTNFQSCWVEVGPDYGRDRDGLLVALAEADISARRGIMAAHRQPAFAGRDHGPLPMTEHLTDNTLILPVYHQMSESEQARVIDVLRAGSLGG